MHLFQTKPRVMVIGLAIWAAIVLPGSRATYADDEDGGITVTGSATITAKATVAEISASVSGDAELAADAAVKYRDAKKKALAAIDAIKNPDLTLESDGPVMNSAMDPTVQMRMMQGMANDTAKQHMEVSESLRLVLKNIDKIDSAKLMETLAKIIDAGRDAGMQIGPPAPRNYIQVQMMAQNGQADTVILFKLPDSTEIEQKAYQKASDDARHKAEMIAGLSGVKLGGVLSVTDQGQAGTQGPRYVIYDFTPRPSADAQLSSTMTDIPVTAHILVKYAIVKSADQKP